MAAQLFDAACRGSPQIVSALEKGDVGPLSAWLKDRVWRHGRRYGRDELLVNATGRKLDPAPYLRHLSDRYSRPN